MTFEVCSGLVITALQTSLSTAVGVCLAFPILSQIIESKSLRIIQECRRVLAKSKVKSDRFAFMEVGRTLTGYQFFVERLARFNEMLMVLCAAIGAFSFFMIIFSTINQSYCISEEFSFLVMAVISAPFVFGMAYLLYWFDGVKRVKGVLYFYDREF